ncbi:MAG: 3-oxoacyl-ACP synthase III family protein, partial [Solirubrobacteraceae bacterium]
MSAPAGGPYARPQRVAPIGLGAALPDTVLTSAEIEERLGLKPGWLVSRTHIEERRILAPDETLAELAAEASRRALADAGVDPADVDLVIVACLQGDDIAPSMSPVVAHLVGAHRAGGFDVASGCSGFVAALATSTALVETGRARTVLVVAADAMSRITDPMDRATAGLLGDGAAAMVIRGTDDDGVGRVGPSVYGADGGAGGTIWAKTNAPSVFDGGEGASKPGLLYMNGHDTYLTALQHFEELIRDTLAADGTTIDDIDLLVPHQANGRILEAVRKRLDLPEERMVNVIARMGNTSAATIPLALAEARADGRLRRGSRL